MEQYGLGVLGLTVEQLYDMTPREFDNALRGKLQQNQQGIRAGWEQARWMVATQIMVAGGKKSKVKKPEDVCKFPWELEAKRIDDAKRKADLSRLAKSRKKFAREGKKVPLSGKMLSKILAQRHGKK